MRSLLASAAFVFLTIGLRAQLPPVVTSWILNPGNETGYGGILSNVLEVDYTTTDVYVHCTCIPGYDIGPWAGNPNTPANQDFTFKITRDPQPNTGTPVATPLGHIGVWRNGVSIFNAKDAMSYNNQGIWNRNAIVAEGPGFDLCNGHPAPNGEYHHHLNPTCLYDALNDQVHSPIIGYAFDGYAVYGAYGFANADGTGGVHRMESSYRMRAITQRHQLPDGTVLSAGQYGPDVSTTYPLGLYLEDFEYVPGLGDLDEHNGRFSVTPEYPDGAYCYFVTVDSANVAAYPYTLGPNYYGTVPAGNTGPQSGHNTVPTDAVMWNGSTGVLTLADEALGAPYPDPTTGPVVVPVLDQGSVAIAITDAQGRVVEQQRARWADGLAHFDLSGLPPGIYAVVVQEGEARRAARIVLTK